jgi:hypothetical protein
VHLVAACRQRDEDTTGPAHEIERRAGIVREQLREPRDLGLRRVGLLGVVEQRRERTER